MNLEELKMNLINQSPSIIGNRENMFNGPELSTIDFNETFHNIV